MRKTCFKITKILVVITIFSFLGVSASSASTTMIKKNDANPNNIIFQVTSQGDFVPPFISSSNSPTMRLYVDSLFLVQEYTDNRTIIKSKKLRKTEIKKISTLITPFLKIRNWGRPSISDMPNTEITLFEAGRKYVISVYALDNDYNVTPEQKNNRVKLRQTLALIEKLKGSIIYKPTYLEAYPSILSSESATITNLANPASVLCVSQGYSSTPVETAQGSSSLCNLPSGPIDEWENYRNVQAHNPALPTLALQTPSCVLFKYSPALDKLPKLTSFLTPTGALIPYALRPLLPNELPCQPHN